METEDVDPGEAQARILQELQESDDTDEEQSVAELYPTNWKKNQFIITTC